MFPTTAAQLLELTGGELVDVAEEGEPARHATAAPVWRDAAQQAPVRGTTMHA